MPSIQTRHFGEITYEPDAVVEFPVGLYAFEEYKRFLLIERDTTKPFWFLQSLDDPVLTFLTLPAQTVDSAYALALPDEDTVTLGLEASPAPQIGQDLLCLFLVTTGGETATANLLAPVVINPAQRKGVQVIQFESGYSHQHPLGGRGENGTSGDPSCS